MKKAKFSIPKLMMIVAVIALTTLLALSAMAHREMKVGYGPGNFAGWFEKNKTEAERK